VSAAVMRALYKNGERGKRSTEFVRRR
jgi:hypothetical protein